MTTTLTPRTCVDTGRFGTKVLLADGDREEHLLMSAVAAQWAPNLVFDFVSDGAELLVKLAFIEDVGDLPSIIVLDRHMPNFDGIRALCELQAHPVLWQIPVLMTSSRACMYEEIDAFRTGARWYQQKPQTMPDVHLFFERIEAFAADCLTYQSPEFLDLSLFNLDYAADINGLFGQLEPGA